MTLTIRPGRRALAAFLIAIATSGLAAQNLKDDISNNDLAGLKSKVALLSPDFKDFAYLAHYLKTAKSYQQAMMDYLLDRGASPDQADEDGVGPLYWAIARDNLEAVNALVAKKANVNAAWASPKGSDWNSVNSLGEDRPVALELFNAKDIEFEAYSDLSRYIQLRPLAAALYSQNTDIVPALLKAGADPMAYLYRIKDEKASAAKKSPVYAWTNTVFDHVAGRFAASGGDLGKVSPAFFANAVRVWRAAQALPKDRQPVVAKDLGANLFAYFATGDMKAFKAELVKTGANTLSFLPYAALAENWDIIDLIYQYNQLGVDDPFDDSKQSLLAWAIGNLHTGAARVLLENGAAIPKQVSFHEDGYESAQKQTPLVRAVSEGKPELVKLLLSYKVDPNEALPLAYAQFDPGIRRLLLEAGAKADARVQYTHYGEKAMNASLLFDAAREGSAEAVAFWLAQGMDPQGDLAEGNQPLVAAVASGDPDCVKALLAAGASADVILLQRHLAYFQIDSNLRWKSLRDYAANLYEKTDNPLEKNRANQIQKLLDKALAARDAKYKVGDTGPAGGIVFFDKGYEREGWRYLEAAPTDLPAIVWSSKDPKAGITRTGLGTGKANTANLVAELGEGDYAASACDGLSTGGFDDWFLPSLDELKLLVTALPKGTLSEVPRYWTSSQYEDTRSEYAYSIDGSDADEHRSDKSYKYLLRPIRAF